MKDKYKYELYMDFALHEGPIYTAILRRAFGLRELNEKWFNDCWVHEGRDINGVWCRSIRFERERDAMLARLALPNTFKYRVNDNDE